MAKSADVFPNADNPDAKVREVQAWLKSNGVRNFEPVSLFCDQLKKVRNSLSVPACVVTIAVCRKL